MEGLIKHRRMQHAIATQINTGDVRLFPNTHAETSSHIELKYLAFRYKTTCFKYVISRNDYSFASKVFDECA